MAYRRVAKFEHVTSWNAAVWRAGFICTVGEHDPGENVEFEKPDGQMIPDFLFATSVGGKGTLL